MQKHPSGIDLYCRGAKNDDCKFSSICVAAYYFPNSNFNVFQCNCDGDSECVTAKLKIEACRDSVTYATRNDTVVSCTEARWICFSDAECGKALEYYHLLCRSMFRGRKCSERCKNSLNILKRQEKAAKLQLCQCEPDERIDEFSCQEIKDNMNTLCTDEDLEDPFVTTVQPDFDSGESEDIENEIDVEEKPSKTVNNANLSATVAISLSWSVIICILLISL